MQPDFEFHAFPRTTSATRDRIITGSARPTDDLYGTPIKPLRNRSSKSAPASDAERRLPLKAMRPEVEFFPATSATALQRLEKALRERDIELEELRHTIESNERALLRSLDDERRRWAVERQQLQSELMSARRHGPSAFRCPASGRTSPGERAQTAAVVVVEPSQRPLPTASEQATNVWTSVERSADKSDGCVGYSTSSEVSLPLEMCSLTPSSDTRKNNFETESAKGNSNDGVVGDDVEKLRLELELCLRDHAAERRQWNDEKRLVVEYQLRLQTYCRQLADRNQTLEERLRELSLQLEQNGGSSGSDSDNAALIVQFLNDSNLLTSSL